VLMKPCPVERLAATIDAALQRRQRDDRSRSAVTVVGRRERPRAPGTLARVLVVDGDRGQAAASGLRGAGYDVTIAGTFPEGVRALEHDAPDLLVAAVRLGDYNGLQFLVTGKARVPTIVIGDEGDGLEHDARQLGADYLQKPVAPAALVAHVNRALGKEAQFAATRRWRRKPVKQLVPARANRLPAHLVDVSYGGLCLEIEEAADGIPLSFDITLPAPNVSVRADVVWMARSDGHAWRCGAELSRAGAEWRDLVDTVA